jgi:ribonuclease HIII
VSVASVLAKYIFESEVEKLELSHQIKLKGANPVGINPLILKEVAKTTFKNVKSVMGH